jgi:hypothetical protein
MKSDIFNEDNEVKSSFVTWGKVGDYFVGTLIGKRVVPNTLSETPGATQTVYEFKMKEGTFHRLENKIPVEEATPINKGEVYNVGGKVGIDAQMRNIKPATIVGMKFIEEKEAKKKGFNKLKVVKVYTTGELDKEYLDELENDPVHQAMEADRIFEGK